MLLCAEHIYKNYGMKQLLQDATLYLNEKDRLGILGINGTGKSTLMKILAGQEPSDEGNVVCGANVKTVYLPQNPVMNEEFTVLEQVIADFKKEHEKLNDYEAKAMLTKLGITDFAAKIGTLSGGQRKRVALAIALIRPCDILILDEPTNHLDSEMVCWLEQYLCRFTGGIIMVTHDRYFLERITNHIVELSNGKLYSYEANYSKYLELKAQREEIENAGERKRQVLLRQEYQWIMRGARARGTKSRERIERYEALKGKDAPIVNETVQMATMASRLGRKIIELKDITKAFDKGTVINGFSYMIGRDERIGIVGKNGVGKSTLLNIISGALLPDSGSVDIGTTVKIGYFMQECRELDNNQRVFDFISGIANEVKTAEGVFSASQMLERFLFYPELQYSTIGRLSGGERRRLYLLSILMEAPNILLLDEPTNDLDIETLTILEDYLAYFPGAVMAVSHDRYFLDKIAKCIFEVSENGNIVYYTGNYSDYSERALPVKAATAEKPVQNPEPRQDATPKQRKLKFTFKEQREYETIDEDIAGIEAQISLCENDILKAASDYMLLQALTEQKAELAKVLDEKTERWVYLNELSDKIEAAN
ncbi:MAG: ABC-F family ATP-binding cassette domain-containing protein [Oscillospiraceae bacterium]